MTLFIFTQWNEYWNAKQRAQHMYMVCRFYYQFTQRISTRNVSKKKIKRSLMVIIFIISSCSNDGFSQQSAAMHNMLFNFMARSVYNIIRFGTGFEKATISRIMVTYEMYVSKSRKLWIQFNLGVSWWEWKRTNWN